MIDFVATRETLSSENKVKTIELRPSERNKQLDSSSHNLQSVFSKYLSQPLNAFLFV